MILLPADVLLQLTESQSYCWLCSIARSRTPLHCIVHTCVCFAWTNQISALPTNPPTLHSKPATSTASPGSAYWIRTFWKPQLLSSGRNRTRTKIGSKWEICHPYCSLEYFLQCLTSGHNQASPDTVTLHLIQKSMNHLFELEYFWSWSLQQSKLEQQQKRTRTNSERVSYIIYQHSGAWMFKLRRIIECSDLMDCYGLFVLCNVPGTQLWTVYTAASQELIIINHLTTNCWNGLQGIINKYISWTVLWIPTKFWRFENTRFTLDFLVEYYIHKSILDTPSFSSRNYILNLPF